MIYWQSFIALTDATVATFGFDFKSLIQRTDIWVGQKDFIKKKQVFTKDIQFAYINSQNFICKLIDPNSWLLTAWFCPVWSDSPLLGLYSASIFFPLFPDLFFNSLRHIFFDFFIFIRWNSLRHSEWLKTQIIFTIEIVFNPSRV